jgi:acyl-coenzyme A synthetase/AMP-(fatty) acid ligase
MTNSQPRLAYLERVLSMRAPDDTLISFLGSAYTASMLANRSTLVSRSAFAGKSVLILARESLDCALCLFELDGVARRMVICPPEVSRDQLETIAKQADIDVVICDKNEDYRTLFDSQVELTTVHRLLIPRDKNPIPFHETEWILMTSGTTGEPKLVVHDFTSLTANIKRPEFSAKSIIWTSFNDIRRFSGLQMFLHALLTDSMLVLKPVDMTVGDFLRVIEGAKATHVSGTPTHWRKVLMFPNRHKLGLAQITLVGEIADQQILDALRLTYPKSRITHIYGSTETGTGFTVHDGKEGFPVSLLGQNRSGLELAVVESMLMVRSVRAARRYLGKVEKPLCDENGFIESGDLVELRDGRYCFLGRKSGAINIGGSRVHPEEVEAALNADSRVHMSAVSARKSAFTGSILVADVVLTHPLPATVSEFDFSKQLITSLRKKLDPYKIPATIRVVPDIETSASGKLDRQGG